MDWYDEDPDWNETWAEEFQARREYRRSDPQTQTLEAIRWEVLPRLRAAYLGHPLVASIRSQLSTYEPHLLRIIVALVKPFWQQTRKVTVQFQHQGDVIRAVAPLGGLSQLSEAREIADPNFDPAEWAETVIHQQCQLAMSALLRSTNIDS
jgi:hypothetical protein